MKRLHTPVGSAAVGLARSVLASANIPFEVRNEFVSQAIPGAPFDPELWVNDEDFDEATRLLATPPPDLNDH
jgi:hypothetical protein